MFPVGSFHIFEMQPSLNCMLYTLYLNVSGLLFELWINLQENREKIKLVKIISGSGLL